MTLDNHTVRSIRSEAEYDLAIEYIRDIWEAELNTPEGDWLDVLMDLVELYESKKYQIGLTTPPVQYVDRDTSSYMKSLCDKLFFC